MHKTEIAFIDGMIEELNIRKAGIEVMITRLVETRAELISMTGGEQIKKKKPKGRNVYYSGLTDSIRRCLHSSKSGNTVSEIVDYLIKNVYPHADRPHLRMRISTDLARLGKQGEVKKKGTNKDGYTLYAIKASKAMRKA